jgi:peptidyl-prolyl cis-trans isomerase B (cyclophilin B)
LVRSQASKPEARPRVEIRTTLGNMVVELYNETPVHRDNFLKLSREGFYDSLIFHRVIPGFMVQGGDPGSRQAPRERALGTGGPGYTLPAEIVPGLVHHKGALAAARQGDDVNPDRRSSGSQFYIVHGRTYQPNELTMMAERLARMGQVVAYSEADRAAYARLGGAPHLDGGYTIFGRVVQGLEVLDAIAAQPCDGRDRPVNDVRMFIRPLP